MKREKMVIKDSAGCVKNSHFIHSILVIGDAVLYN